jgi:hypothetical protein
MSEKKISTLLVDAHVHIYDCFDLDQLFDAALFNFTRAANKMAVVDNITRVLLLSETSHDNWFARLAATANPATASPVTAGSRWSIEKTPEKIVLKATSKNTDNGESTIFVIAGRQIVTAERLELLALLTDSTFEDGLPVIEVLRAARSQDAIPVLPWAVCKWFGKRGKILSDLLQKEAHNELYLGDNGGRPSFWSTPSHFKEADAMGVFVLPGSDSLPLSDQVSRAGSYGFSMCGEIDESHLAADIKRLLRTKETELSAYGQRESPCQFFDNQIRIRRIKK